MKEAIEKYFEAWINKDAGVLNEVFGNEVVYSECYGPEYHGIGQLQRWFADWNRQGSVLAWDIKRTLEQANTIVVEWNFACVYQGKEDAFDGVTIADFNKAEKIIRLKEFQSKKEHCFPYGE